MFFIKAQEDRTREYESEYAEEIVARLKFLSQQQNEARKANGSP